MNGKEIKDVLQVLLNTLILLGGDTSVDKKDKFIEDLNSLVVVVKEIKKVSVFPKVFHDFYDVSV